MARTRKTLERLEELKDQLPEGATVETLIDKAKQREAIDRSRRIQPGVRVDPDLWMQLRQLGLNQKRSASDLLEEAMRDYLEKSLRQNERT